jgi:hypothetical protein
MKNKLIFTLKILISIIVAIIVIPIILLIMPLKHVETNIDYDYGKKEKIDFKTEQIYVEKAFDLPGWTVLGKDRIIFNDEDRNLQSVFIYGDFPKKINYEILENTFVLNGEYVGKKEYKGKIAGCFKVESWGVLGGLERKQNNNLSHSSLTGWDYLMAEEIRGEDEDELKSVE